MPPGDEAEPRAHGLLLRFNRFQQRLNCRPTSRDRADGGSRHRSRGFRDGHTSSIRVERAPAPHSPGSGQPTPRCHAARTALPTKRANPHDVSPRTGRAASVGWILVRRIHPSPQPAPNLRDRPVPAGVVHPRTRPGEPLAPLTHSSEGDPEPIDNSSVHHPTIASIRPSSAPPSSENHRTFRMGTRLRAVARKNLTSAGGQGHRRWMNESWLIRTRINRATRSHLLAQRPPCARCR
jgi:hypothetical protein